MQLQISITVLATYGLDCGLYQLSFSPRYLFVPGSLVLSSNLNGQPAQFFLEVVKFCNTHLVYTYFAWLRRRCEKKISCPRTQHLVPHTAVKRGARAQFPPKLSLNKVLNFRKFSLSSAKLRQHPQGLPACNFLSQYYFYNIFLQKSYRFSLQTLAKFEAAKTGTGVGFLRLTAVW